MKRQPPYAAVKSNIGPVTPPTSAPLASQRLAHARDTVRCGTAGAVHSRIQFTVTSLVMIDATFRIGAPQMEQGAFATSFIPTTSAAVTRSYRHRRICPRRPGMSLARLRCSPSSCFPRLCRQFP